MLRLGGANVTSADPAFSSAAKGESLADTIRVISNYADIVVIRHPRDGAARLAAEYSQIPIINGGDGSHEHPTQTLCDLFTLRSKNKNLRNMKVAISGDLKGSRTIHSFVYALARFGATIEPLPAPGMELPAHVDRRMREEFHSRMVSKESGQAATIDALYVTSDQPHQLSLYAEPEVDYGVVLEKKIDAVYVTRFQKERWTEKERSYPKIDAKFLGEPKYSEASVMHPLPRVNELDASLDTDRRAIYFQQAAYGVPVRMALISLLLHLHKNKSLHKFPGGFAKPDYPVYSQPIGTGLHCANGNCITRDPTESQYATNKFYIVQRPDHSDRTLRCVYCEVDIEAQSGLVVADTLRKTFAHGLTALAKAPADKLKHLVIYGSESEATDAGFQLRDGSSGKLRSG
jgi:aspartate carbamoyltransferase catalytic subunit